jgi:Leucine-rich repeat (LRR) protein
MTQLKSLKLSRAAGITISGIEQLVTLQQLQNLDLSGCTITDADMPRLRALLLRMPRLQSINLTYCGLSQSATNDIRNLRQGFAILY